MNESNEVTVMPQQSVTPMAMLEMAVQQGADIDKLTKLLDLQERWEKNEARKAFVVALSQFKANPPSLTKNKHVSFETSKGVTEYDHATLDHVSLTIGKALSQYGLSHRWDVEQLDGGLIKVTCVLTHSMGHSERVPMQTTADDSGGKNKIQAIGSAVTYLQRYTLLAATGMAVQGQDNDGAATEEKGLPDEQFEDFVRRIEAQTTKEKAKAVWQESVKACKDAQDVESANKLKAVMLAHAQFIDSASKAA